MKKLLLNKINKRRLILILLLPFVIIGSIYVYQKKKASEVSAIDLISVSYNGNTPPVPVFYITNMLPGDEVEKVFNVKNVYSNSLGVTMKGIFVDEEKGFAGILEIIIGEVGGPDIYGGSAGFKTVRNFLDESSPFNLGTFPAGTDKSFRVKVKFPASSGNEYQEARVVFDIEWSTQIPQIQLPFECRFMQITKIIEGTEKSDHIVGTGEGELIFAKGGNDHVKGKGGDDCIVGGDGNDNLDGGSGNDIILGGNGNDNIDGGSGNDIVYGGEGNDSIEGGSGNDKLYGENGNDTIRGGSGNDELYGGAGNDNLHGGSGDDILDGGVDTDTLHGDVGHDTCTAGESLHSCEL
jgi:Ca2+-binding RTX toxin-like protein